ALSGAPYCRSSSCSFNLRREQTAVTFAPGILLNAEMCAPATHPNPTMPTLISFMNDEISQTMANQPPLLRAAYQGQCIRRLQTTYSPSSNVPDKLDESITCRAICRSAP